MAVDPLPNIRNKQVYADLLALIKQHSTEAYNQWPQAYDVWCKDYHDAYSKLERRGQEVWLIAINPEEFIAFCEQNKHEPTPHNLERWARHDAGVQVGIQRNVRRQVYDPLAAETVD